MKLINGKISEFHFKIEPIIFILFFWNLDLCQVLLFFVQQSCQGSRKIELKMQLPFMSKNRHLLNFESAQYKCFLYKFSTRCAEPIFYLVKIQGFFFLIPVLCETFDFESYIQNSCHFWNLESFSFHMRPNLTIFRQNFVFTIYMIELLFEYDTEN